MPSGAKRRKAAKKKKAAADLSNENGEVKVMESDGGENSSPASQDLEVQQNPFTKDEDKEASLQSDSEEAEKMLNGDGDVVEREVEAKLENANDDKSAKVSVNHGSLMKSTNESFSRESLEFDDGDGSRIVAVELQKAEKESFEQVSTYPESLSKEASHVKEVKHVASAVDVEPNVVPVDKVIHEPESAAVVELQKAEFKQICTNAESLSKEASHIEEVKHVAPAVDMEPNVVAVDKVIHEPVSTAVVELQKAELEQVCTDPESFAKEASHVKEVKYVAPAVDMEPNAVALDMVIHEPENTAVQRSVGSAVVESKSKKCKEEVHPSEIFSDLKTECPPLSGTNFGETSRDVFTKQLPQSNIFIDNGKLHAGSSDIQQSPEKEPLLHPGPANRTSWIGCCGLLELFTGSSR